ncbi:O-antigen ligase family protein, partial [Candidatus Sumerlaeota bacterium]|nr:O-antigen ligase family protein [Candidatus Sumerlaeota bacterium]
MQRFVLPACGGFLGLAFSFYAQSWLDVDYNFWLTFFYIFIGVVLGLTAEHALIAPPYTPMVMRIIVWVSSGIYLYAIILLFTPFTHNVDEIKPAIMLSAGAYIWLIYSCALFVIGQPGRIFKILLPLLGFLALFFLSILLADSQIRWIGWFNLRFYLFTIVMIFIVASTITTKEELIHACSIFTALALLSCLFGILHYYQQLGFLERFAERDASNKQLWANLIRTLQQNRQMFGTILSTDFFAAYLIMALPGAVALSFGASQIYNRILGFVTTLTMLACIYQTNSNETILGVAAFIFIFALGYNYIQPGSVLRRNLKLTVLLSAITLAVLIFMTWSEFVPRIQSLDGAFRARGIIYKGGWDMFLAHPWFGWGPGSFRMIFPLFRHQDYDITEISNVTLFAHNQFLGMLCETGIFSFICYMVFLAMLCRFLLREIRKRPLSDISIFQFAFLGGIVAIHIQNFFSPNYRWVAPAIAYNTMLGLAIASGNITQIAAAESDDETALAPLEAWLKQNRKIWASCLIAVSFIGIALSSKTGFNYFRSAIENNKGILHQQSADKLREYVRRGQTVEGGRLTDEGKELYLNEIKLREKTAVQHFEKSIVYDPTFQTAFYKIAHTYNQQGFHIEALQMYNDLSYLNSDYSEIYYNYGVIF